MPIWEVIPIHWTIDCGPVWAMTACQVLAHCEHKRLIVCNFVCLLRSEEINQSIIRPPRRKGSHFARDNQTFNATTPPASSLSWRQEKPIFKAYFITASRRGSPKF
jgi:hypothetical protein